MLINVDEMNKVQKEGYADGYIGKPYANPHMFGDISHSDYRHGFETGQHKRRAENESNELIKSFC